MTFKVPTVFSAVDKVSQVVSGIKTSIHGFMSSAEARVARGERIFRRLTPALSETTSQMLSFAKAAAIATAIIGTINFSVSSLKNYETAVQSFRTIVSDLSDKDFAKYRGAVNRVAKDTRTSAIDVAQSFEMIAGLNAEFAETASGIGQVSKAAITLKKASGAELGESAANLVGIMNQFSLAATEADRTINVLAAGQAVGAANIKQTAESFVNFGSVAAGANITLEESVGLVQTLGKFSIFGAEAGTKLRGSLLKLQKAGVGYASGQFNINDALEEANAKLAKLKTAKQKDALLQKMFGAENISTGRILLANIDLYKKFAAGVTGTTEAHKAAAINSQTLSVKLQELKNRWVNILTSSDGATSSLNSAKVAIGFVSDNLDTIVSIGSKVLLFLIGFKALLIASKVALAAYNIVLGISGALSGTAAIAIGRNAIALGAYKAVLAIVTAAQWAWNVAMTANPIGLIIAGVAALIGLVVLIINKWNEWGAAVALFLGPLGFVISLIQSFRRNWDMVKESFKTGGILGGLKAIGKVMLDAVLMPIQQILKLIAKFTGAEWANNAVAGIEKFRANLGLNTTTDESGKPLPKTELVNPKAAEQEAMIKRIETSEKQNVKIDITDQTKRAKVTSDNDIVPIKMTSTMGWQGY